MLFFIITDIFAQNVEINDPVFKEVLINHLCVDNDLNGNAESDADFNNDGEIQVSEALLVKKLNLINKKIVSIEGLEYFLNLEQLLININRLTELNFKTDLPRLKKIQATDNSIVLMDLSLLSGLTNLEIGGNDLEKLTEDMLPSSLEIIEFNYNELLDTILIKNHPKLKRLSGYEAGCKFVNLTTLPNLESISLEYNEIEKIEFFNTPKLKYIDIGHNNVTALDLSKTPFLESISIDFNPITKLDLAHCEYLKDFDISGTPLKKLDLFEFSSLSKFVHSYSNLEYLNIKCTALNSLQSLGGSSIDTICCNENKEHLFYGKYVSSFCSFDPCGKFYVIKGKTIFDKNKNGCDNADSLIGNVKFLLREESKGFPFNYINSDNLGYYEIKVKDGRNLMGTVLNNNALNSNPSFFEVKFPTNKDTVYQDFCISYLSVNKNIKANLLQVSPGRPGFVTDYNLIVINDGNSIEEGNVSLVFDEKTHKLLSLNYPPHSQTANSLVFKYKNLKPLEKLVIRIRFELNSSTDEPALNINDTLIYKVSLNDSLRNYNFIVVGSYDPNDKSCAEGEIISPERIGDYVEYLIRFENTGNYYAENVIIEDYLNPNYFDVSSFDVLSASHSLNTLVDKDYLKIYFKGINLPSDSGLNNGFILYRIKTNGELNINDIIKNNANIYFDYNFPILTNTYASTFQLPTNLNEEIITYKEYAFPNPANEILFFHKYYDYIDIYNKEGQLVISNIRDNKINILNLNPNLYLCKLRNNESLPIYISFLKK